MSQPIRSCVACGAKKSPRDLLRIALTTENEAVFSATKKLAGRGAYLCRDEKCIDKALARGALSRSFKRKITALPALQNALKAALED